MRFQPNSRASTDHTPGPSSASAAPRIAVSTHVHGFASCNAACANASSASSVPAIGVHKPARRSNPTTIVTTCSVAGPKAGAPRNSRIARPATPMPAAKRSNSRPSPGAPPAKFEKSRRTTCAVYEVRNSPRNPQRDEINHYFGCPFLNFDDSPFYSNHRGVRPVIGSQFGKDVAHLPLHRVFAHRQLCCNLLVRIALGY
jgi:hypothetical protein